MSLAKRVCATIVLHTILTVAAVGLLLQGAWLRDALGIDAPLPVRIVAAGVLVAFLVGTYDELTSKAGGQIA